MNRNHFQNLCEIVVRARWQDAVLVVDGAGHVVVWAGDETVVREAVDDHGQVRGASGNTTHAHAIWLELQAAAREEAARERGPARFVGVLGLGTTLVTLHDGEGGEERARHLTELLRDAL